MIVDASRTDEATVGNLSDHPHSKTSAQLYQPENSENYLTNQPAFEEHRNAQVLAVLHE